jgi:hypothetical protein
VVKNWVQSLLSIEKMVSKFAFHMGKPCFHYSAVLYKSQAEVDRECASCTSSLMGAGRVYYHCAQPPPSVAAALAAAAAARGGVAAGAAAAAVAGTGGLDLCGRCFTDGRLPDGTTSASFLRTTAEAAGAGGGGGGGTKEGDEEEEEEEEDEVAAHWSDQETLLLLEAGLYKFANPVDQLA